MFYTCGNASVVLLAKAQQMFVNLQCVKQNVHCAPCLLTSFAPFNNEVKHHKAAPLEVQMTNVLLKFPIIAVL
jgi:hypothetical protein